MSALPRIAGGRPIVMDDSRERVGQSSYKGFTIVEYKSASKTGRSFAIETRGSDGAYPNPHTTDNLASAKKSIDDHIKNAEWLKKYKAEKGLDASQADNRAALQEQKADLERQIHLGHFDSKGLAAANREIKRLEQAIRNVKADARDAGPVNAQMRMIATKLETARSKAQRESDPNKKSQLSATVRQLEQDLADATKRAQAQDAGYLGGQRGPSIGPAKKAPKYKVGEVVEFKADIEQSGPIMEIKTKWDGSAQYKINVKQGEYRGVTWFDEEDLW